MLLSKRVQTEDIEERYERMPKQLRVVCCHAKLMLFDSTDARHRQNLMEWCRVQWPSLFSKSALHHNSLFWHDCCSSISKRRFMESAGHPAEQTHSIFKLATFKGIKGPEELYQWMLERLKQAKTRGFKAYMPAVNRLHIDPEAAETVGNQNLVAELRCQLETASSSLAEQRLKIDKLESENQLLVKSSRTWCQLYHGLLEQSTEQAPDGTTSPKMLKTKCFEVDFEQAYLLFRSTSILFVGDALQLEVKETSSRSGVVTVLVFGSKASSRLYLLLTNVASSSWSTTLSVQ